MRRGAIVMAAPGPCSTTFTHLSFSLWEKVAGEAGGMRVRVAKAGRKTSSDGRLAPHRIGSGPRCNPHPALRGTFSRREKGFVRQSHGLEAGDNHL
jgi:hypothetical protein